MGTHRPSFSLVFFLLLLLTASLLLRSLPLLSPTATFLAGSLLVLLLFARSLLVLLLFARSLLVLLLLGWSFLLPLGWKALLDVHLLLSFPFSFVRLILVPSSPNISVDVEVHTVTSH